MYSGAITKAGGRKFIICLLSILIGTGLRIANLISPQDCVDIFKYVILYYVASNVAQKATAKPTGE